MGFLKSDLFTRRCGPYHPQTLLRTGEDARRSIIRLIRDHPLHLVKIGITHQGGCSQLFLALLRFRSQDVAEIRLVPLDLPRPRLFEALGSAFVCFQFRHKK